MKLALAILLCASSAMAQAVPAAKSNPIRLLSDIQLGYEPGYKLPYVQLGGTIEAPIGTRFEVQGVMNWSPTTKQGTSNGQTLQVQGLGIVWATQKVGLTMNVRHDWLWTSAYHKEATEYAPGISFRVSEGDGHRIYLDYLLPYGNRSIHGGVEDSHTQGPEMAWEVRLTPHIRWLVRGGAYHVLTQGNPLCDGSQGPVLPSCARSGAWAGAATVGLRYEWPAHEGSW